MKPCLLLLLLLAIAQGNFAQSKNGYIVTLNNDTIPTEIKLPKNFLKLGYKVHKELEIRDSANHVKEFLPGEIKAFGYTDKSGEHVYVTKPGKDKLNYFLELIWEGKHTCLYQYVVETKEYSTPQIITPSGRTVGGVTVPKRIQEFYTLERFDGQCMFFNNYDNLEEIKKQLTDFYATNWPIRRVIFQRFLSRKDVQIDLKTVIMLANK